MVIKLLGYKGRIYSTSILGVFFFAFLAPRIQCIDAYAKEHHSLGARSGSFLIGEGGTNDEMPCLKLSDQRGSEEAVQS